MRPCKIRLQNYFICVSIAGAHIGHASALTASAGNSSLFMFLQQPLATQRRSEGGVGCLRRGRD